MHNLHLVVVQAENPEQACEEVEIQLLDWGNENNWKEITSCISEDNKIHVYKNGRYACSEVGYNTIEKIENILEEEIKNCQNIDEIEKLFAEAKEQKESWKWYILAEACKNYEAAWGINKIDLFKCEFKSWQFDQFGLTNICNEDTDDKLSLNKYCVFVDMHS